MNTIVIGDIHGRYHTFLKMLHTRLLIKTKDLDRVRKRVRAKRMPILIDELGAVKRAEIAIEKDKQYTTARKDFDEMEGQKDMVEVCVRAFEQRTELLRTLSANIRAENFGNN